MGHGWRIGAGFALAACMLQDARAAPAQPSAASLERRHAEAARRAQALNAEAARAGAQVRAQETAIKEAEAGRVAARAARTAAEAEVAALALREMALTTQEARERRDLERLLATLIQADRAAATPFAPGAFRAAAVGRAAFPVLAAEAERTRAELQAADTGRTRLNAHTATLAAAEEALAGRRAQAEARRAEAARRSAALAGDARKAEALAATLAREARSLRDLAARLATARTASAEARTPAGKRRRPVDGNVRNLYGAAAPGGGRAQGVTIRTASGAKVIAPAAATVGYAGTFRGYGKILILDQGDGYAVILTGLSSVFTSPGKRVSAGDVIGEMAQSAAPAPDLYFEVRQAGRAVDPERWLAASNGS